MISQVEISAVTGSLGVRSHTQKKKKETTKHLKSPYSASFIEGK